MLLTPSQDFFRTHTPPARKLTSGLDALSHRICGFLRRGSGTLARLTSKAEQILSEQNKLKDIASETLKSKIIEGHLETRNNEISNHMIACHVEAIKRSLGMQLYPCQVVSALALREGYLAEMATGEGKTLTIALAGSLLCSDRKPTHVITANDYLAKRDSQDLLDYYEYCGWKVGHIQANMDLNERKHQYANHIVYTTSKELVADFLRDRLSLGSLSNENHRLVERMLRPNRVKDGRVVLRGLHHVIIDEADHVLIDEALTPLILSQSKSDPKQREVCHEAWHLAGSMREGEDYTADSIQRQIKWTDRGKRKLNDQLVKSPVLQNRRWKLAMTALALECREFILRDRDYIVKDDRIFLIDQSTGRLMKDRSWGQGIQQFVELKEAVKESKSSSTISSISFQQFFRLIPDLSGITGTAWENRHEFWHIYELPVLRVPRHRPLKRITHPMMVSPRQEDKLEQVLQIVKDLHAQHIPVLIGTGSVSESEGLSRCLRESGLHHHLLNAIHHEDEADIVVQAGQPDQITIATNMAGRGTDIKCPVEVITSGGLHVISTHLHSSSRIDRQLYGRCARQGDPGSVHLVISTGDELFTRNLPKFIQGLLKGPLLQTHLLKMIARYCQWLATRRGILQRYQILSQDQWTRETLPT